MGFMFRVEQITVTDEYTVLNGHMISGALDWHQRIELQIVDRNQQAGSCACRAELPRTPNSSAASGERSNLASERHKRRTH